MNVSVFEDAAWLLAFAAEQAIEASSRPVDIATRQLGDGGIWHANRGDSSGSIQEFEAMWKEGRLDRSQLKQYQQVGRGLAAYRNGENRVAIDILAPVTAFQADRWWILAAAYSGLNRSDSAAYYLNRLVAREGVLLERDIFLAAMTAPFAHFLLARHYEVRGEPGKAREHFQFIADHFTSPDPQWRWMREEAMSRLGSDRALAPPQDKSRSALSDQ